MKLLGVMTVLLFMLSGCAGSFGGVWYPDWRADEMHVYWVRVAPEKMSEVCGAAAFDGRMRGCARQKSPTSCTVYAPEPVDDLDELAFATLGEEVAHCFYGDFHQ